jgi:GGDEF domain-containing protein
LVPGSEEKAAESFVEEVTETLNAIDDPEFGVPSISWGYSVMKYISENYNDVFRAADAIMYEQKRAANEASISGVVPA